MAKPLSWQNVLRVIGLSAWLVSIIWLMVEPGFDPLITFLTGTASFMILSLPNQKSETLAPSTEIIDVFEKANGFLLILGEPGSGKTTLLLELADQLLENAEEDDSYAVPVIFNLSTWNPQLTIELWLL